MALRRFAIALIVLSFAGFWMAASAQTNQPILFHTFDLDFNPLPIMFDNGTTYAEEGWAIQVLCVGPDGQINPPVLGFENPAVGEPDGDDFLADPLPLQNNVSVLYVNYIASGWGPGYEGCLYSQTAVNFPGVGSGTEPVINVGDWVYLRAFNSDHWSTATRYTDWPGMLVESVTPGLPIEVYGVQFGNDYPLPVELLSFTANPGNNLVNLEWVTASEKDNDHFTIYRDGEKLIDIPTQAVGGESSEPLTYNYKDSQVTNGVQYTYEITAMDINGVESEILSEEVEVIPAWNSSYVVTAYNLHQNYPNPFNPGTTIEYDVLETGKVYLTIYNIKGQEVAKLVNGEQRVGPLQHVAFWDAQGLSSGIYFYQVRVNDFKMTKKMILVQ